MILVILSAALAPDIAKDASASNMGRYVFQSESSRIALNFFANYDYFSRDVPFRYVHELEALDVVRSALVRAGRVQDLPIVITVPSPLFVVSPKNTQISLEQNCSIHPNDDAGEPRSIGKCYRIHVVEESSHENLLALTTALQRLTSGKLKIVITDIQSLKREEVGGSFKDISHVFDPAWSPDGHLLLYTVWQDGMARFEVMDPTSNTVRPLQPLKDYMVARPIWSPDSRYIAYASLNEIRLYDTKTDTTQTILLTELLKDANYETVLSFSVSNDRLTFAGDTNLFSQYHVYNYDPLQQRPEPIALDSPRPEWAVTFTWDAYSSLRRVESPTGRWVASIKDIKGLRRMSIERGGQSSIGGLVTVILLVLAYYLWSKKRTRFTSAA